MTQVLKYVPLERDQLTETKPRVDVFRNQEYLAEPSPYDVPVGITAGYDVKSKRLSLALEYVADEPTVINSFKEKVALHVGKNSGRIYQVDLEGVDLDQAISQKSIALIDDVIDRVATERKNAIPQRYAIAKQAINVAGDLILKDPDGLKAL
ncbi:MAG: hypothetical protein JOZ08_12590 [Verrucomicrobia bacterium]|nr:hypothetical protein [Verrucomicrobiota bacterium]MBV8280202.1 hypothetical protein [Verrucomicrobiota bacterium]